MSSLGTEVSKRRNTFPVHREKTIISCMNRFYCIHCVADIFIYKLSATGICNTIIIYLSGYYSYFIAGGRSMLYFSTFIEVYLKRTEAIRSFTKFSIFSVVEYKETIHALPVSGLSNIENCQINTGRVSYFTDCIRIILL